MGAAQRRVVQSASIDWGMPSSSGWRARGEPEATSSSLSLKPARVMPQATSDGAGGGSLARQVSTGLDVVLGETSMKRRKLEGHDKEAKKAKRTWH